MKLLSLVWFKVLPARFGGQKGTALFNRYLAESAELVCLCSSDNVPEGPLPYRLRAELPSGKRAVLRPQVWQHIDRVIAEERPTHILLEYPYHAYAAVRAAKRYGCKVVLHEHNIEYRRFRQLGHPGWRLLKAYERWACRNADLVLFKTEEDRAHAVQIFGIETGKTQLVPYGIEPPTSVVVKTDIRRERNIPGDALLLLFAGTLDYAPNAEAVQAIYRELAPRLDASGRAYRILVCGRNRHPDFQHLESLQHPCVQRTGEVPDLAPYYAAADVFVNPVLSGGGVQTKMVDALAAHLPVVCFQFALRGLQTALAAEKVASVPDGHWDEFALQVAIISRNTGPTPDAFLEQYDWQKIARRVVERLEKL